MPRRKRSRGDDSEKKGSRRKEVKWDEVATMLVLILIFALGLFIRSYWYWGPATDNVEEYGVEGHLLSGNDPNYHKRTVDYIQETKSHLIIDPLLNYPQSGPNPNPPIYSWSIALSGYALAPFYGGDLDTATWVAMEYAAAFWAALTIFPVYVFTRDMFGRKPGLFAAFFLAVMAGNVERTPVGFSDHDGFMVFFVVLGFLFLMRAMRELKTGTYIKNVMSASELTTGTVRFFRENRKAVLNALMAGIAVATVALSWKGVAYVYAIVFIYFLVHLTILKIKKEENFGLSVIVLIAMGTGLLVSYPYYQTPHFWAWYTGSLYLFTGMAIFAFLFVATRDQPWLVTLPAIFGTVAGAMAIMSFLLPEVYESIVSLQGYFLKTKLYETIAEAQAPDFNRMVFSYGVVTTYLALIGIGYSAYLLPKQKWRNDFIVTIMWAGVGIYMAMSAVRFMYNATPIFAIMSGWITWEIIRMTGFDRMWKNYQSLKRGQRWYAFRQSVKPRHVGTTLFVVFLILLPNTFYGIDAGVPYEKKREVDEQLFDYYDKIPDEVDLYFGKWNPKAINGDEYDELGSQTWFLGSFGTAFPSDYWVDGMMWLADQDNETLPEDRPAFISWWDYGHWAVHMGQHPSAADNFQNSFQWAGQFISAQNETQSEALMVVKIWEGVRIGEKDDSVNQVLLRHMTPDQFDQFFEYWKNPEAHIDLIKKDPLKYGPRTKDIDKLNARYLLTTRYLIDLMGDREMDNLLWEMEMFTGKSMRYFAMDSRLMPFTPQNTGIYYAPIKLSDQNVDDHLYVNAITETGASYKLGSDALQKAAEEDPDFRVDHYEIVYQPLFFNSMFYKCYIGWQPLDIDVNEQAVPALTNPADVGRNNLEVRNLPPMQGWGMKHYRLVYKTTYWNPNETDLEAHREDWEVVSPEEAAHYEDKGIGTLDKIYRGLYSGVFFIKFYHGAYLNGTVTTPDGEPLVNATVTIYDDVDTQNSQWFGIPHDSVKTDERGRYSLLAPFGNCTVVVSNGGTGEGDAKKYNLLMMKEDRILNVTNVQVTDEQAMRISTDVDNDGVIDYNIRHDIEVDHGQAHGRAFWDVNGDDAWTDETDIPMTGVILLRNETLGVEMNATLNETGHYGLTDIIPNTYNVFLFRNGAEYMIEEIGIDVGSDITKDLGLQTAFIVGNVTGPSGEPVNTSVAIDTKDGAEGVAINETFNGTFSLGPLFPGNYTLRGADLDYHFPAIDVDITEGVNASQNLSLERTAGVTGRVGFPDGSPAVNAYIGFINMEDEALDVVARTAGNGAYEAHLAAGNYSVYSLYYLDGRAYSVIEDLTFGNEEKVLDLTMAPAHRVNGTVFYDQNNNGTYDGLQYNQLIIRDDLDIPSTGIVILGEERKEMELTFVGKNGMYMTRTNKGGYYEAYLPEDDYTLMAYSPLENSTYSYVGRLALEGDRRYNVPVNKGTMVAGTVYHDINNNNLPDPGEYLEGNNVTFELKALPLEDRGVFDVVPQLRDGIDVMLTRTWTNGTYEIYLTKNATYEMVVRIPGFDVFTDTVLVPDYEMHLNAEMVPANITISGTVGMDADGNGVIDPDGETAVDIKFEARWRGDDLDTVSLPDGTYEAELAPGVYRVTVDIYSKRGQDDVRLMLETEVNLTLGSGPVGLDLPLDVLYKVTGKAYYDENGDGLPQKSESRIPEIRFVDSAGLKRTTTPSTDGKWSIHLPADEYTVYSKLSEISQTERVLTSMATLSVKGQTSTTVQLHESVRLNGVVYFDENLDGALDRDEPQGGVLVNITDITGRIPDGNGYYKSVAVVNSTTDQKGTYSVHVPNNRTYMISVTSAQYVDDGHSGVTFVNYNGSSIVALGEEQSQHMQDVPVEMVMRLNGTVFWFGPEGEVLVDGVKITLGNLTAYSDATGVYEMFIRPGEYDAVIEKYGYVRIRDGSDEGVQKVDVELNRKVLDFELEATNVTVAGSVFPDPNGNFQKDPGERGFLIDVQFKALGLGVNRTVVTDRNGNIDTDLEVGDYEILIDAYEMETLKHYSYLGTAQVRPTNGTLTMDLPLEESALLKARFLYDPGNADSVPVPVRVNISFTEMETGLERKFDDLTPMSDIFIKRGVYNIASEFELVLQGRTITFRLMDEGFDLRQSRSVDLLFEKEKVYDVELVWDKSERAEIDQNESVTYRVKVKNIGNEVDDFRIGVSAPDGWVTTVIDPVSGEELKEVSLELDETTEFDVRINTSKIAAADENSITVSLTAASSGARNSTYMTVDVLQHFNLSFGETDYTPRLNPDGIIEFETIVKNDGNGEDSVELTVSPISGWNITLDPETITLKSGAAETVRILVGIEEGGRPAETILYVKAHSKDGEMVAVDEVEVDFPDVSGSIRVDGERVEDAGTEPVFGVPGFEGPALLAAVAIAIGLIGHRRRRNWGDA